MTKAPKKLSSEAALELFRLATECLVRSLYKRVSQRKVRQEARIIEMATLQHLTMEAPPCS